MFYGAKYRIAPKYPRPKHETIVEPFAGAAGYSVRHYTKQIILVEIDEKIASLWDYLIHVTPKEILALPDIQFEQSTEDLPILPEARHLIGFWINKGTANPCKKPSSRMKSGTRPNSHWGPKIRTRIANQVQHIRHWKIIFGNYTSAPDTRATWFIDPPYQEAGRHYRHNSIDYPVLADWCRLRKGQVLVCENTNATWLPFEPFHTSLANNVPGARRPYSREALWIAPSTKSMSG